ncbi:hypothetical protein PTKIN_Ptkin18bG0037400 [Pterospermum kingtungense]
MSSLWMQSYLANVVGDILCYGKYLIKSLSKAREIRGHILCTRGPYNVGSYNSTSLEIGIFGDGGDYDNYYGKLFLSWYSQVLVDHVDCVLALACIAFEGTCIPSKVRDAAISIIGTGFEFQFLNKISSNLYY